MSVELIETPVEDIPGVRKSIYIYIRLVHDPLLLISALQIVDQARQAWLSHQLWSEEQKREFTLKQLKNFKRLIEENTDDLCQAIKGDLNKVLKILNDDSFLCIGCLLYYDVRGFAIALYLISSCCYKCMHMCVCLN